MLFCGIWTINRIEVDDCPTMLLGVGREKGDIMGMRGSMQFMGLVRYMVGLCEASIPIWHMPIDPVVPSSVLKAFSIKKILEQSLKQLEYFVNSSKISGRSLFFLLVLFLVNHDTLMVDMMIGFKVRGVILWSMDWNLQV